VGGVPHPRGHHFKLRCACLALVSYISFCLIFRYQKEAGNAGYLQPELPVPVPVVTVAASFRRGPRLQAEMRTGIMCLHFSESYYFPDSIRTRALRFLRCILKLELVRLGRA
jgi:hypothetical protein